MPARNVIYRHDWETVTGVQMRFEIIPAHQDDLDAPTIVTLPEELIYDFGKLQMGYDKLPIGVMDLKTLTMKFNLSALTGSTELTDLRTYLIYPLHAAQAMIGPVGGGGVPNQPIDMYTWCRLYAWVYDIGSPGYRKIFEGALRPLTTKKYVVSAGLTTDAVVSMEVQWTHIAQVVMETLRMPIICKRMLENVDPGTGNHKTTFDVIYEPTGSSMTWCVGQGLDGGNVPMCRIYTIDDWFDESFWLLQQIYQHMVRNASATFVGSNNTSGSSGHPLTNLAFFKQSHDGTTDRAGKIGGYGVIGRVWPANKTMSMSNDVAGLFVGSEDRAGEQNSFYRFAHFWDWAKVCCEGAMSKCEVRFTTTGIRVWWGRIFSAYNGMVRTISNTALLDNAIEIEEASRTLSSVQVAVPGMEGDDSADYESVRAGVENEEDRNVRLMFHTLPKLGSVSERVARGEWFWLILAQADGGALSEVSNGTGSFAKVFSLWTLWYFSRPQTGARYLTPADVPIRCHNDVEIDLGTPSGSTELRLHDSAVDWTFHQSPYWPDPSRGTLLASQRTDGYPQQVANIMLEVFGHSSMKLYRVSVLLGTAWPEDLGEIFQLGSGSANDWITPDTFLAFSSKGVLVDCQLDVNTGVMKLEILTNPILG